MTRRRANETNIAEPWWAGEDAVRLAQVPSLLPPNAVTGKPVTSAAVYGWCTAGLRGVRLRRFKVAGGFATTRQELQRWQQALTALAEAAVS